MTPHFPIYMDYGATTPVDPRVVDLMIPWLREHFGNPASRSHAWGWEAEAAVERARGQVASLINADPREIVWTSGATESNNLALKGAAHFYESRGKHLVTVKTEHKCVLDTMRELERQGYEVTYLDVQENGLLDLDQFKARSASSRTSRPSVRCAVSAASCCMSTLRRPPASCRSTWPRCLST
jgi:cysteine desulfurase